MRFQPALVLLLSVLAVSPGCGGKAETAATPPPPQAAQPAPPPAPKNTEAMPGQDAAGIAAESKQQPSTEAAIPQHEVPAELIARIQKFVDEGGIKREGSSLARVARALNEYIHEVGHLPAIDGTGVPGTPHWLSWRVAILPQLGYRDLYDKFHFEEPWDTPHNLELVSQMPRVFGESTDGTTRLHVFTGPKAPFQSSLGIGFPELTDGPANTLLVVEAGADKSEPWTKPGGLLFDPQNPVGALGDVGESFLAVFADQSIHRLPSNSPYLAALIAHRDRKPIPQVEYYDTLVKSGGRELKLDLTSLPPLAAAEAEVSSRFIPDDCLVAFIASPRRIFETPFAQNALKQQARDGETIAEVGCRLTVSPQGPQLPLAFVEEFRIVADPQQSLFVDGQFSPQAANEAAFGLYLRAAVPVPVEEILESEGTAAEKYEMEMIAGIPHVWMGGKSKGVAFLSDKEYLLASKPLMRMMLLAKVPGEKKSALATSLESQKNKMILMTVVAPPNEKIELLQQGLQAAGPMAALISPIGDSTAITLSLDLESPEIAALEFQLPKPEQAQQLAEVSGALLSQGMLQAKMFQESLNQEDPAQKAQADLIGDVMAGTAVAADGSALTIKIQQPMHLDQLLTAFQPSPGADSMTASGGTAAPAKEPGPLDKISEALMTYHSVLGHFPAANGTGVEEVKVPNVRGGRRNPREAKEAREAAANQNGPAANPMAPEIPAGESPEGAMPAEAESENEVPADVVLKAMLVASKNKGLSWRVYLLPLLGEIDLFKEFKLEERWDGPHNKSLITRMPAVYGDNPEGLCRFQVLVGADSFFKTAKGPSKDTAKDDHAQTLLVIETGAEKADFWTKPGGLLFDPRQPLKCLGKPDEGQTEFHAVMLDGTVTAIPVEIEAAEFKGLVQPSDGKPAGKSR